MQLSVIKIADSASGKSTVISLQGTADTLFGESKGIIYNHSVKAGTCKVVEGQIIDVPMDSFAIESSELTYQDGSTHVSYWLRSK